MFFKKGSKNAKKLNDILKNDNVVKVDHVEISNGGVDKVNNIEDIPNGQLSEYSEPKEFELKQKSFFSKIIKALLVILGVSIVGFSVLVYFFIGPKDNKTKNTNDAKIDLKIISTNIDLDGRLSYEVSFKNNEEFNIQYANLEVRLPQEFSFLDSDIAADSVVDNYMRWAFKNISIGEEVKFNINGIIFGKTGSEVVMSGSLNYKLDKISSSFTASKDYSILVTRSLIDIVIDRPEKIESNSEFDYKIKIRNNSGRVFKNVGLRFGYKTYFNILSSSEEVKKKNDDEMLFIFDLNKPVDNNITDVSNDDYYQKIVTIRGVITNDKIQNVDFGVDVGIVEDVNNLNNIEYLIQRQDSFNLANSGFVFNVSSNINSENVDGSNVVLINDINTPYKINLKYKKDSDKNIFKNVRIKAIFTGDNIFDFSGAKYSATPEVVKNEQSGLIDNSIEWSYGNLNNLKDISVNENSLDISMPFNKGFIEEKNGLKTLIMNLNVYGLDSSNNEILLYKNPSLKIAINTGLSVVSKINYYDENHNQVGFGPNPPKIGQETKYRVDFNINNKYNSLSDVILTTKLSSNARYSYEYNTSNGFDLLYDEGSNSIRWDIKSIGKDDSIFGSFYVYIVPQAGSAGKVMQPIDNVNIKYNDIDLGREFVKDLGPVTGDKITQ